MASSQQHEPAPSPHKPTWHAAARLLRLPRLQQLGLGRLKCLAVHLALRQQRHLAPNQLLLAVAAGAAGAGGGGSKRRQGEAYEGAGRAGLVSLDCKADSKASHATWHSPRPPPPRCTKSPILSCTHTQPT